MANSDATNLRVTHQKATERQTATMLWLIVVMTVLTILMAAVPTGFGPGFPERRAMKRTAPEAARAGERPIGREE